MPRWRVPEACRRGMTPGLAHVSARWERRIIDFVRLLRVHVQTIFQIEREQAFTAQFDVSLLGSELHISTSSLALRHRHQIGCTTRNVHDIVETNTLLPSVTVPTLLM